MGGVGLGGLGGLLILVLGIENSTPYLICGADNHAPPSSGAKFNKNIYL